MQVFGSSPGPVMGVTTNELAPGQDIRSGENKTRLVLLGSGPSAAGPGFVMDEEDGRGGHGVGGMRESGRWSGRGRIATGMRDRSSYRSMSILEGA